MRKKLTIITSVAMLMILIGKADAVTLTLKYEDDYIKTEINEGQEVTLKSTNSEFLRWTVEKGDISINTSDKEVSFEMPSSEVVIKLNIKSTVEYYKIRYNANGGTGSMGFQTVEAGEKITLLENKFSRDGYTFLGWSTSSSATSATYVAGDTITISENTTLYAVWE